MKLFIVLAGLGGLIRIVEFTIVLAEWIRIAISNYKFYKRMDKRIAESEAQEGV